MSNSTVLHAYRNLYRTSLQAVQYARPARFEIRDILREAFRTQSPASFNPRRISNTIKFLENARAYRGYEHQILKNLLHLQFWRTQRFEKRLLRDSNSDEAIESRRQIWHQYRATLTMLNESLDTCLTI